MKRAIHLKCYLPYKREQVWHALTDSGMLGVWFMKNDFKPLLGHEFTFRMAPQKGWDGVTHCKITELEPLHSVAYSYRGSATGEKTIACAGIHSETANKIAKGIFTELDTELRFRLSPAGGGTILEMEHSGFRGLKLVIVSFVMGMGWKKQLRKKLPRALAALHEHVQKEMREI